MRQYDVLIEESDRDIRSGFPHRVAKRLAAINLSRVPDEFRLPLAKICRRAGLYFIGLRLLSKVMEPLSSDEVAPADAAEYSALLVRIGATSEALERLANIDPSDAPEVFLYRAYAHFSLWQYEAAISSLEKYLETSPSEYAALVGQTNLGFAYAGNRNHELAIKVLSENIRMTKNQGFRQLQSTSHALRAQVRIQLGEFAIAREDLECASQFSDKSHTNDNFLRLQWQHILDGLESKSQEPFDQLRSLALAKQNWEACREADFYSLLVTPNRARFVHLYFGTPFREFRQIIHQELGARPTQPIYVLGQKKHPRLDLTTGKIDGKDAMICGAKMHQMLCALLGDFYQQPRIAGLFSNLFPGEHFNISTSPARVHQIIWRTRDWLRRKNIPVEILETDGFYSLKINGEFSFRVPMERAPIDFMSRRFEQLKGHFGFGNSFLAHEAQTLLHLSKTTVYELIKWGLENGKIEVAGLSSRSHIYSIVSQSFKKAA